MSALSGPAAPTPARDDRDTRRAWACLAAAPFLYAVAVAIPVVASGTVHTTDRYPDTAPPSWTMWLLIGISLVIYLLPAAGSRWFWLRAQHVGDDREKAPAVILLITTLALPALFMTFLVIALRTISE